RSHSPCPTRSPFICAQIRSLIRGRPMRSPAVSESYTRRSPRMRLNLAFAEALAAVEAGRVFLPFVGGEAARIERCAVAAKRCFGLPDGAVVDPYAVATAHEVRVIGDRDDFQRLPAEWRKEILGPRGRQWS